MAWSENDSSTLVYGQSHRCTATDPTNAAVAAPSAHRIPLSAPGGPTPV